MNACYTIFCVTSSAAGHLFFISCSASAAASIAEAHVQLWVAWSQPVEESDELAHVFLCMYAEFLQLLVVSTNAWSSVRSSEVDIYRSAWFHKWWICSTRWSHGTLCGNDWPNNKRTQASSRVMGSSIKCNFAWCIWKKVMSVLVKHA